MGVYLEDWFSRRKSEYHKLGHRGTCHRWICHRGTDHRENRFYREIFRLGDPGTDRRYTEVKGTSLHIIFIICREDRNIDTTGRVSGYLKPTVWTVERSVTGVLRSSSLLRSSKLPKRKGISDRGF
ncbi:hypothetical protein HZH68_006874 [Vespula germanica]|uniref:Uncharacterized protein n=1 Tax=Vespula germanica TaxID=30212 RepID=A0A834KA11_VESGE|nr:hypothetical protein HZH68_006874 [Vespula germanica]